MDDIASSQVAGVGGSLYADSQLKVTYNVKVAAVGLFGSEGPASAVVVVDDKTAPTALKVIGVTTGVSPVAGYAAGTAAVRGAGNLTITFNKPMVESDVINNATWAWNFAAATTATVTPAFGTAVSVATPITWSPATNVATVPWSITTDATGVVPAGAHTISCTAKSVSGALAVTGSF